LKLPIKTRSGTGGGEGVDIDEVSIFNPDHSNFSEKTVGLAGMKVDWKFLKI